MMKFFSRVYLVPKLEFGNKIEIFTRSNGLRWNAVFAAPRRVVAPISSGIARNTPLEGGQGGVTDVALPQGKTRNHVFHSMVTILSLFLITTIFQTNTHAQIPSVDIDQSTIQYAKVTKKRLIKLFLEDFMIPDDGVSYLVIYDLNGDGFGEGDLAQTYPTGKVYLTTPTPKVQQMMNGWSFGGNIKFTAHAGDNPDRFENAPDSVRAMGGIFASVLRGIRRNYQGKPIKIYLEQSDDVASVQIWGYDPSLMKYTPLPVNKVPEEVPVMKLIYLQKTVVDSVFTGTGKQ